MKQIDIKDYPEIIDKINNCLNNNSTIELKVEKNGKVIVAIEVSRTLRVKSERK